jgi:hypothetical protein
VINRSESAAHYGFVARVSSQIKRYEFGFGDEAIHLSA